MLVVNETDGPRGRSLVLLVPLGLWVLALVVRLVVAQQIPFPTTEVSAYFVGVAGNALEGNGLVSDAVWSYATPPLEAPTPAFEIWLPMASLMAVLSMGVLGASYGAAQVSGALMGALIAPLVWGVAREAVAAHGLDRRRGGAVALAAGLIAAVLSPFVLNSAIPDSYVPFTVFTLVAALLLPRVLGLRNGSEAVPSRTPVIIGGLALGLALGLAYLSRQEVIWFGLTALIFLFLVVRGHAPGTRSKEIVARLWPIVAGGLVAVLPWLARNIAEFGTPLPGQAVENMFLRRNEDIFAFMDRPGAAEYLAQGLGTVLSNPLQAALDVFVDVLVIPAFPIGIIGIVALVFLRRSPAVRRPTALATLLVGGTLVFATTVVLFPVATLWGTFAHASGPLLAALVVLSALGGDALLARISAIREWERPNIIVAPMALLAVVIVLGLLQTVIVARQSRGFAQRYANLAAELIAYGEAAGTGLPDTVITDHPMWLATTLGTSAIALPDEDTDAILELSRTFSAPWLVVVDERGRYPDALISGGQCLAADPVRLAVGAQVSWLFVLDDACDHA